MREGWRELPLGEIAVVGAGNSAPQGDRYFGGDTPFFRTSDVGRIRAGVLTQAEDWVNDAGAKGMRLHPAGTLLIPKSGASTYLDHRVLMGRDGYVSSHLATVKARDRVTVDRFLFYAMLTVRARDVAADTSYPTLSLEQIKGIRLPVPPLAEQERIVAVLDEAFDALATGTANTEAQRDRVQAAFDSALSAALKPGKEWTTVPFEQALNPLRYTTKIQRNQFLSEGKYPIISQEAEFINGYWNDAGDVLHVASPLVVFGDHTRVLKFVDFDFVLGADGVKLLRPTRNIDARFFYYALRAKPLDGLGYARHYRALKESSISFPEMSHQKRNAARLDELSRVTSDLAAVLTRKLALLAELKQCLLARAFSGELTAGKLAA